MNPFNNPLLSDLSNPEIERKVFDYIVSLKQITPSKRLIFDSYTVDMNKVNLVIVNTQPFYFSDLASGLLFGMNTQGFDKASNVCRKWCDHIALHFRGDIALGSCERKAPYDYSLKYLKEQNVLMINVNPCVEEGFKLWPDSLLNTTSSTFIWREILMDNIFNKLNNWEKPLVIWFIGNDETMKYYISKITNFYHEVFQTSTPDKEETFDKEIFKKLNALTGVNF